MDSTHFSGLDGFVWFIGVVEDNNDPDKLGRVKVRAYGHHTPDLNNIPLELLPWATVMSSTLDTSMQGQGTFRKLEPGTWVIGFFLDAEEKQQPVVMGTLKGKPNQAPNKLVGFNDPNESNPTTKKSNSNHGTLVDKDGKEYDYSTEDKHIESDVNRLARNETVTWIDGKDYNLSHSVIGSKDKLYDAETHKIGRTEKVQIANTTDEKTNSGYIEWDEPKSPYAASYPNNNVMETASGHIKEYDDTSGQERIHEYHKAGTFYEIDKDGNKITRVVGNNYDIIAGTNYVKVRGDVNLTIDSNCKTRIKGNYDIEVDGDKTEVIKGKLTQTVTGSVVETYKDIFDQNVTGDSTIDAKTINLNSGTKGAARLDDQVDTGDDPAGISGSDGSNKIESSSTTVIIGD